ncbi:MAG: RNA polymerase sigma-54 factor, partial [Lactobacillus iners]|nr:RNA polymerase sigma-54 factor [Lactobacillus iners]
MKYKNGLSLRLKESLITRLFLSPKLKQDLDILSYNTEDLLKVLHDIAETNPFIDLKYTNANTTTLDWVQDPSQDSLVEYLIKQIQLSAWSNNDKKLVTFLIYKLDNNGYLRFTCKQLANEIEYSEADIQNAKNLLHELSPLGVGAYDLNECLLIQAKKLLHFNPIALAILEKHLLERLADTSSWNSLPWKKEKILEALKEL